MRGLLVRAIVGALVGGAIVIATVAHSERVKRQSGRTQTDQSTPAKAGDLPDIPLPGRRMDALKPAPVVPKENTVKEGRPAGKGAPEVIEAAPVPDEWPQEQIISALRDCIRLLGPIASEVEVTVPIKKGACGTAAPVRLRRIGREHPVVLSPPATMNCPMVVALHKWIEAQVQPEAKRTLGSPVVALENVSAYNCRQRNGSKSPKLSEHALANAIDIGRFRTADGQTVSVLNDWGPTARDQRTSALLPAAADKANSPERLPVAVRKENSSKAPSDDSGIPLPVRRSDPAEGRRAKREPDGEKPGHGQGAGKTGTAGQNPAAKRSPVADPADAVSSKKMLFLKRVHERACGLFGTVLGPEANEAHRDHFHFDLAPRRRRAYCE